MKMFNRWLVALLALVAIKQGIFISIIPTWQVPDEPAHVAYVQAIVDQGKFPIYSDQGMDVSRELQESLTAIEDTNPNRIGRHYPPGFLSVVNDTNRQAADNKVPVRNLAARNSPLYYLYESLPYWVTRSWPLERRVDAMRIASAFLLLGVVWLAIKIAQVFSANRWFCLAVGFVVGFHPAASLLFTGVNPDAALTFVATWAFWLMVQPVAKDQIWRRGLWIAVTVALAASIKTPGWFLVAPALAWYLGQYTKTSRQQWWLLGGVSTMILLFVGAGWLLVQAEEATTGVVSFSATSRPPLSWQRVLENDLFQRPIIFWRTWWGHSGWSGVSRYNEPWVYLMMLVGTIVASMGMARTAWRRHWTFPVVILITGCVALEIFYQVIYWQAGLVSGTSHFPIHGRYYLPLIVPVALFLVFGIGKIFPRRRSWIGYGIMIILMTITTTAMIGRVWELYRLERAAGW